MKNFFIGFIFLFYSLIAQQQEYVLSGRITDNTNQPLPFAAVSVLHSNKGTTANDEGKFELKLLPGDYQIIVQYLGYKKKILSVHLMQDQNVTIVLTPEEIALNEVPINASEDPAYAVIRRAIKKRNQHHKELKSNSYQCEVYIKGVQKLNDIPDKIMGMDVKVNDNEKGIFYLSETRSRYFFVPPDKKKEIIKASRVSGQSKGFSFNRYIPMQKDIYENSLDFYFISNRPFISPISDNALFFYKYKMQGTFYEDGKLINKIEVIPKSATEPCFRGYIYIEENTWRVHSFDFYITKEAKLNFIDTLWLKQVHTKVNDSLYYPVSIQYLFNFNVFGIKGSGYFIASVSDYVFNNTDTLAKNFFKNEIVRFEKDAIKNDSVFWNNHRPIPLSKEEKYDYLKKDSIEKITTSPRYLDSVDRVRNKFKMIHLVSGYTYQNSKKQLAFHVDGLMNAGVQYNTIEGINITVQTSLKKNSVNETEKWEWKNYFRYGIANQLFGYKTHFTFHDNFFNFRSYGLAGQYYVEPYNHQNSISEVVNSAYTLLDYRNYLKMYLKKSVEAYYRQELFNGFYFNTNLMLEERMPLRNTYSLNIFQKKNYFTSNNPMYPYSDSIQFPRHQGFLFNLKIRYQIKQRYTTYPYMKYVWKNKYPVLVLEYNKAIPFNNTMVNYDVLQVRVNDKIELNYFGDWKWEVNAGKFFNTQNMYFMDFKHFPANQTIVLNDWNSFRFLNYFNFSTKNYFVQLHTEYNLRGLIMGRLPLIKKYKIEEVITAHYLYSDLLQHYYEWSVGLDKLFYVFRLEYALAYYPFMKKPVSQFMLGLNFLNKK